MEEDGPDAVELELVPHGPDATPTSFALTLHVLFTRLLKSCASANEVDVVSYDVVTMRRYDFERDNAQTMFEFCFAQSIVELI